MTEITLSELLLGALGWKMLVAIMFFGFLAALNRKVKAYRTRVDGKHFSLRYWLNNNWQSMINAAILQYGYAIFAPWVVKSVEQYTPKDMPLHIVILVVAVAIGHWSGQIGDYLAKLDIPIIGKKPVPPAPQEPTDAP